MTPVIVDQAPMRELLYNILTCAVDDKAPETILRQEMGVQLSSAVLKEKGVLNIQVQSVAIQNIMLKVTDALKMLDRAPLAPLDVDEIGTDNGEDEQTGPTYEQMIENCLQSAVNLKDYLLSLEVDYVQAAFKKFDSTKEVLNVLEIGYPRLKKVREIINNET